MTPNSDRLENKLKIGLLGASGRMGRAIQEVLASCASMQLIAASARKPFSVLDYHKKNNCLQTHNAEDVFLHGDVIIDFSMPEATDKHLAFAQKYKKAYVLGVTGLSTDKQQIFTRAGQHCPFLYASNTSIGAVLMRCCARMAAGVLHHLNDELDVSILDRHHKHKRDKPSGTALALAKAVEESIAQKEHQTADDKKAPEIQIASFREGTLCGSHELTLTTPFEQFTLNHTMLTRTSLAQGALIAAQWLATKEPGLYTMEQVLDLTT